MLDEHGVASLLFPPLVQEALQLVNRARGREAFASRRNALAHYFQVSMALCRWFHVAESMRQPLRDWYDGEQKALDKGARAAKRLHRQASTAGASAFVEPLPMEERRVTALDWVERISLDSTRPLFPLAGC